MLRLVFKIPFLIIKIIIKIVTFLLSLFFGFLFGWIPDFDERMSGEDFEEYVLAILKRNGFKHLRLTQRTGDYGIDILGEYKYIKYAFQCKKYHKPVGISAVQQAYAGCVYYQCDVPVVVTNQRFTSAAMSLAQSNDVELWDGQKLQQLKRKANSYALFHRRMKQEPLHPYHDVIELLLQEETVSCELLMKELHYSKEKAIVILDDLSFYGLVSNADESGYQEVFVSTYEEAIDKLDKKS